MKLVSKALATAFSCVLATTSNSQNQGSFRGPFFLSIGDSNELRLVDYFSLFSRVLGWEWSFVSKLYFRYSTMGAGKSAQLLIAAHNYIERGMNPLLITFAGDTRSGVGVIKSRIGIEMKALTFDYITDLEHGISYDGVDAIFVDEAQFLNIRQVEELHRVAAYRGIPVLCYGLRSDFLGRLFEGSAALMAHAETLEELKTICDCGRKATHVRRFKDGVVQLCGETIQIGDLEYKPLCYKCFENLRTSIGTSLEENGS